MARSTQSTELLLLFKLVLNMMLPLWIDPRYVKVPLHIGRGGCPASSNNRYETIYGDIVVSTHPIPLNEVYSSARPRGTRLAGGCSESDQRK